MSKKRFFTAISAFFLLAFGAARAQSIEFESELLNFGTAMQGDIVEKKYRFTNKGSKPLLIVSAKGSCGCTRPTWPDREIKKGEWAEIGVEFNTAKRADEQAKMVKVETNDPDRPFVVLRLEGRVLVDSASLAKVDSATGEQPRRHEIKKSSSRTVGLTQIEFNKTTQNFGRAWPGDLVSLVFEFKNVGEEPFLLSSVRDNCNCLKLDYTESEILQPGQSSGIQVTFNTNDQKPGEILKTIMVGGNIAEKEIALTLKGKIRG